MAMKIVMEQNSALRATKVWPKLPVQTDSSAGRLAKEKGAVTEARRIGVLGADVGTDYFDENGNIVLQAMRACGNPQ